MKRAEVIAIFLIISFSILSGCISPKENKAPEPSLAASSTFVDVNETVTFSANESTDQDGEIVGYFWDMGDGTNYSSMYVTHNYEKGGNYTVILIVTDNDNKKAVTAMTIHVNELPRPIINMTLFTYIHETVYFWANDSYDSDGYVRNYFWDFGDGENDTGPSAEHIYSTKDKFKVTLTLTDNDGAKAASSLEFQMLFRIWEVKWIATEFFEVFNDDGTTIEGTSDLLIANITVLNITQLIFDMTWNDLIHPPGEPNDLFEMNVTSPEGTSYVDEGMESEQITITVPESGYLNPVPQSFQTPAESADILEMELAKNYTSSNGIGDWAINITLVEAHGIIDGVSDNSNDWDLSVVYYYYLPVITRL